MASANQSCRILLCISLPAHLCRKFFLSLNDARMEAPLTAFIITVTWQLILYIDKRLFLFLSLSAFTAALAFSTKGWIGPVIIFVAAFFYLLQHRSWSVLFSWKTWT